MEQANAAPEQTALAELKTKILSAQIPTLEIARLLQAHLDDYPQSQQQLAEKLELPEKRTFISQALKLLKLPLDVQKTLEGKVLSSRKMYQATLPNPEDLLKTHDDTATTVATPVTTGDDTTDDSDNKPPESSVAVNNVNKASFPLLKDTVDTLSKLVVFWSKAPGLGDLAERWAIRLSEMGWLKSIGGALAILLAGYGGWAATRDVKSLLSPRRIVSRGPSFPERLMDPPLGAVGDDGRLRTPQITSSRWIEGHKLLLTWNAQAPGTTYRIYWNSSDGQSSDRVGSEVSTPGAIVGLYNANFRKGGSISVTAISPDQTESAASRLVAFEPNAMNHMDSVEPLPVKGMEVSMTSPRQSVSRGPSLNKGMMDPPLKAAGDDGKKLPLGSTASQVDRLSGQPILNPPTELHADIKTPDLIYISWRPVSKDARYNVYSSGSRDLSNLRKENPEPITTHKVEWIPETGLERYWVVATSLDAQNHESAYSETIEVIRYPDKKDYSGEAAGILRKVLPW